MSAVSVCIPTHNRQADLARTLAELRRLDPPPDEIVVLADGCTDGTEEFVRREHPGIRLLSNPTAVGCVVGRNLLLDAAAHEIVLGLDDDSYPLEDDFIARLRVVFAENPRMAVASFPQRTNEFPESLTASDFGPTRFAGTFVNCACAFRRSVFQELGGYPGFFLQSYDEPDYSLRCLAAGWEVMHHTTLTVRHHFTPQLRNEMRTHQRHARNEFWSVLLRAPWWLIAPVALFRLVRQFRYAWSRGLGWAVREPKWWWAALAGAPRAWAQRRPVRSQAYRAWMCLIPRPVLTREELHRMTGTAQIATGRRK